jgi:hypothetical protein
VNPTRLAETALATSLGEARGMLLRTMPVSGVRVVRVTD